MEFMTNLQSGLDEQKPSLFELLSEQQLSSLIPPSLRYLLALATHRSPRYLLRILNSFDELYALVSLLIERHYLLTYNGTFTENFYGLKRERVLRVKNGEIPRAAMGAPAQVRETLKLRSADVWRNLVVVVGLPYVKRKLDESYDIHAASAQVLGPAAFNSETLPPDASLRQRVLHFYKWFLRRVYPSLNAAYYFSVLAFNLLYLFDSTKFSSPFLYLIGTRIRRLNSADHNAFASASLPPSPSPKTTTPGAPPAVSATSLLSPRSVTQTLYPHLLSSLKLLLPTSIFALKFLEWWHASDFARQLSRKAAEGLELPPPIVTGMRAGAASSSTSTTVAGDNVSLPPQKSGVTFDSSVKPRNGHSKEEEKEKTSVDDSKRSNMTTGEETKGETEAQRSPSPPISSSTFLPIFTVPPPPRAESETCPICRNPVQTPTAAQTGYVYCYTCIFRWVEGEHPLQEAFMKGQEDEGGEGEEEGKVWGDVRGEGRDMRSRWEDGRGRCAVTGRRLLGGAGGLRRVMV